MKHKQKHIAEIVEQYRTKWFAQHVAECQATGDIFDAVWENALVIRWQNPASCIYGVHFIIHRRWLIVVGNLGEAAYEWSEDLSMNFLAGLDFGYFAGKCRASEHGEKYETWDYEVAEARIKDRVEELETMDAEDKSKASEKELEALLHLSSDKDSCDAAAREYYDETRDAETAGGIASVGMVPDGQCIGHFLGIQMAIQQLKERKP